MERVSTFSNLGIDISNVNNIQQALANANLDYIVENQPLYYSFDGKENQMKEFVTPVRLTDGHNYGVVSSNYGIVQNGEAFDFINYIDAPVQFIKAGETATGMVYVICKIEEIDILGDKFTPYILFRNSFNGRYTLSACICPLRIVCQNQFNIAFKDTNNTINLRHSKNIADKYVEAQTVLAGTTNYLLSLKREAEKYAGMHISPTQRRDIINAMFPIDDGMSDRQKHNIIEQRVMFEKAYNAEDNSAFEGSAWSLINAYTDTITHAPILRNTKTAEENKFISVTFDPKIMQKMLSVVDRVAA